MHNSNPASSYVEPGSGGRQPVAVVGAAPHRRPDVEITGRRPVVGILDSGCGAHTWLDGVVDTTVQLDGLDIGYGSLVPSPEAFPDQLGPLDGVIDDLSGHGTFIAGLVHQTCPDADIVAWRVVRTEDPMLESDLVTALSQIAELVRRYRADPATGHPLDVLNLSMGYYHEDPTDALFDSIMLGILQILADAGVVVVASAGNDATSRPCFPAAFSQSTLPIPVVAVGALNPNAVSDALFSNTGDWVTAYRPGAAVVSTMPAFQGGYEPMARTSWHGRHRDALDPDDFRGGFAVWSGTSFSAPVAAAEVAGALLGQLGGAAEPVEAAVERARGAVAQCFG